MKFFRYFSTVFFLAIYCTLIFFIYADFDSFIQFSVKSKNLLFLLFVSFFLNSCFDLWKAKKTRGPIKKKWLKLKGLFLGSSSILMGMSCFFDFTLYSFMHIVIVLGFVGIIMSFKFTFEKWHRTDLTPGRMVLVIYGVTSFIGAVLLSHPILLKSEQLISFTDALFVSISALTVTGLTTVDISQVFNQWGLWWILLMIQVGGLGVVVFSTYLVVLTRKKLSVTHSLMGQQIFDIPTIGDLKSFIERVVRFTLFTELVFAVIVYFSLPHDFENRIFTALFHSVSAFCNAGFSTFTQNLNLPNLWIMKSSLMILIALGSFGFPVVFELYDNWRTKKKWMSSNSTLTLVMTLSLYLIGFLVFFGVELPHLTEKNVFEHGFESLFYTVSSRTAGFNLTPVDLLSFGSQLLILFLMVIGGSPLSCAGGIKTTTLGILTSATFSLLKGHKWAQYKSNEIPPFVIQKAVAIVMLYLMTWFVASLLLITFEKSSPFYLVFEAASALSTVGLSLGVTADLHPLSKYVIMFLMIAGRLGLVTLVYVGLGKLATQRFRYAKGQFYIG